MNPLQSVYELLASDETILSSIGLWNGGPAITSADPDPDEMDGPFITLSEGSGSVTHYEGVRLVSQPIEVGVYSDNVQSLADVRTLADYVFSILDAAPLRDDSGTGAAASFCTYPAKATSNNGFQGYTMTCTVQAFNN